MTDDTATAYLNTASALLNLPINPEHFADVLAAFRAIQVQAKLVTEFPLPAETESTQRFTP
jgi:hypothetical protein